MSRQPSGDPCTIPSHQSSGKPTPSPITHTASERCHRGINPRAKLNSPHLTLLHGQLCVTGQTIQAPAIADHAFYAKADGYFPDRWDIGELMDDVLRKACWYYDQLKAGKAKTEFFPAKK